MLANFGLSMTEYRMFVLLSESPDKRLRMSDLASDAHHSASRSSHTIARMEARGWVLRSPCDNDRRVTYVTLTDLGADVLAQAAPTYRAAIRRVFIDSLGGEQAMATVDAAALGIIAATAM